MKVGFLAIKIDNYEEFDKEKRLLSFCLVSVTKKYLLLNIKI